MNRKTAWAAMAAVLSVLAVLVTPTPASAAVAVNRFRNYATGQCLDYYADRGLYTTGCNSGKFQEWIWNNTPGIATPMRQEASDWCLTVTGDYDWVPFMAPCDSSWGARQQWYVSPSPSDGGIPFIRSVLMLGGDVAMCLSYVNNAVKMEGCGSGIPRQRWVVLKAI
ncbi:RICIN domain-containing protein [Streptomyces jeddahensis]|uniref:Ricin-type beta-trefoil lectin domain protein n=1 Tax=Streptomyces jeddahensis TaxID=1716141 RepID=A0A177HWT7_9ACTN|nr:hypothetical protein [Streptomyces jeddahensis]OAH15047.1 ricin-type beta-trefoil lectin domain protein [Streptomyces jeddahensis]